MNPVARSHQLRRRAADLRRLADEIETMPAMSLERHAGDDVWHGPRARLCRSLLASSQRQVHQAADDLRTTAYRFELQAEQLEAATRMGVAG